MKRFKCRKCGQKVYFENAQCLRCGSALGFDSSRLDMASLERAPDGLLRMIGERRSEKVRYCSNAGHGVCNWLTRPDDPFCDACDLNRTIPNLSETENAVAWGDIERAKKRLVYSLLSFGLPLDGSAMGKGKLTFDFMRETTTGHLNGVITINVAEADAVERERQRLQFAEPYRTLLGHMRHESGHFYWMLLIEAGGKLDAFRAVFGDERQDYAAAVANHHAGPPAPDWQERHVSAYASAHPWEDWAETWAHYMHMVDVLESAEAEGVEPRAAGFVTGSFWPFKTHDVYRAETFEALLERWIPLTLALNVLNRSMGHADFYPFVVSRGARKKLAFVHDVIRAHGRRAAAGTGPMQQQRQGNGHAAPPGA